MPEKVVASYWNGNLTRAEFQKIIDGHAAAIQGLAVAMQKLDVSMGYMAEKFGVKPEDIVEWAKQKAEAAQERVVVNTDGDYPYIENPDVPNSKVIVTPNA